MNISSILSSARNEAAALLAQAENIFLPALKSKAVGFLKSFGVTDDQVTAAETAVQGAATAVVNAPGDQKRATALEEIKKLFADIEPFLANLLIDSVFGYLRAAGKV